MCTVKDMTRLPRKPSEPPHSMPDAVVRRLNIASSIMASNGLPNALMNLLITSKREWYRAVAGIRTRASKVTVRPAAKVNRETEIRFRKKRLWKSVRYAAQQLFKPESTLDMVAASRPAAIKPAIPAGKP